MQQIEGELRQLDISSLRIIGKRGRSCMSGRDSQWNKPQKGLESSFLWAGKLGFVKKAEGFVKGSKRLKPINTFSNNE